MSRSCSWFPKVEASNCIAFNASTVGNSSNALEITGDAPKLSPDDTVTVAALFARSVLNMLANAGAPMFVAVVSIAP